MIRRNKKFEPEVERMLRALPEKADLRQIVTAAVKMIGEEIDHIESNIELSAQASAGVPTGSSGVLIIPSGAGVASGSTIAGEKVLVAGAVSQRVNFGTTIPLPLFLNWRTWNSVGDGVGITIEPGGIDENGFFITRCEEACTIGWQATRIQ